MEVHGQARVPSFHPQKKPAVERLPALKLTASSPLKIGGWNMNFLLEWPICRCDACYVRIVFVEPVELASQRPCSRKPHDESTDHWVENQESDHVMMIF